MNRGCRNRGNTHRTAQRQDGYIIEGDRCNFLSIPVGGRWHLPHPVIQPGTAHAEMQFRPTFDFGTILTELHERLVAVSHVDCSLRPLQRYSITRLKQERYVSETTKSDKSFHIFTLPYWKYLFDLSLILIIDFRYNLNLLLIRIWIVYLLLYRTLPRKKILWKTRIEIINYKKVEDGEIEDL